ncbi:MAG: DUF4270 domain-containing protein [Paramuribaculum sp.]|nr:DUF4270 domain-containing protein [Paramuribaculum sp.]
MSFIKHLYICAGISTLVLGTSCQDNTSEVGSSLVSDQSEVIIDSLFTVSGNTVQNSAILSRTTMQLLGGITAPEYGQFSSGFVTQFMPAQNIDTDGVSINDIDSVKLVMFIRPGGFTGDSIVPMGLTVYKLTRQLPASITSAFDPNGYYNTQPWATAMYSANALHNDSIANLAYRTISVPLPREFGQSLYKEYVDNPTTFSTPQQFAKFFPGIYVKSTFGSGRVMNIVDTRINIHYTRHATIGSGSSLRDTTYHFTRSYLAVTPEIITDNIISYTMSAQLENSINSDSQSILVAPAGTEVQMNFPATEILSSFRSQGQGYAVLNKVSLSIPAESIKNSYGIKPPANVLIILSRDKDAFFANNKINDDKTSFLATYSKTSQSYDIANMRDYILSILSKEKLTPEDYTFTITPVDVVTESTSGGYYTESYVTGINPYVNAPAMTRLRLDKAKIKVTFSKQTINN